MKNTFKWLRFAAVIAAIALFSTVSCEEPDNGGGTSTFTVTFNLNGGSGTAPSSQTVSSGSSITLPSGSGLTKSGYSFGGWNTNTAGTGTNYSAGSSYTVTGDITLYAKWIIPGTQVPGQSLAEKLQWLVSNAESGGDYVLELSTAYESIAPQTLSYTGRSNVSVRLRGSGNNARVVELSSNGSLFTIGNGVTMILDENIVLSGRSNNDTSLIRINNGGTLTMNGGKISGNTGGGVSSSGTFTMNGGEISGNTASSRYTTSSGGINERYNLFSGGGGVSSNGTFTMTGGEISGNTASSYGNSFYNTYSYGGGVYVSSSGTFVKTGGTIYGNNVVSAWNGVENTTGGRAVYVSTDRKRETTAGTTINMDSNVDGTAGGWE